MKLAAALVLLAAILAAAPLEAQDPPSDIDDVRQRIEDIERRRGSAVESLDWSGQQEKGVLEQIEGLDRRLADARRQAALLRELEGNLRGAISQSEARLAQIGRERDQTARDLAARSAALYKASGVSYLKLILDSKGIEDLRRRRYYLKVIARRDSVLFSRSAELLGEERRQMGSLEQDRGRLTSTIDDLGAATARLEEGRRARTAVLSRIRSEKSQQARLIEELDESAGKLKSFLDTLERETAGQPVFPRLKGSLPRPVVGRIIVDFGKNRSDRFDTYTLSRGVTIQAAEGTPVLSVHRGRVIYADWFRGFGRIVILDHGGNYYTLYGHLSSVEVEVGREVESRQVLGLVGDSGSLEGPSLYFEIRHRGSPLDPKPWFAG